MNWPKEKTAILVIHGIGQQNPFDTLDAFVRGLLSSLDTTAIDAHHKLFLQDGWAQNYISLVNNGNDATSVDCFEYYWAHATQRQINVSQVFDWLVTTGEAARKYYDENLALVKAYEGQEDTPFGYSPLKGRRRFDKYWYLKYAASGLKIFHLLIGALGPVAWASPIIGAPIKLALTAVAKLVRPIIVDVVGDIAIYTAVDMKSQHFEVRKRILDGATDSLEALIKSKAPEYQRIIVVGHSLGSVVAYDALNRVNNAFNSGRLNPELAAKVRGLVTFGSPLDKIAFFFRVRVEEHRYIKHQILSQYIGFKAKNLKPGWTPPHLIHSHIKPYLDAGVRWINFWDSEDPISGPLDFYQVAREDNRRLEMGVDGGKSHTAYWEYKGMYQQIVDDVLCVP
ncbi:MAG: lipase family protein [SAR202 cluster bacterium]|nr:lipase family protein [SAR202 cluster bacterium]